MRISTTSRGLLLVALSSTCSVWAKPLRPAEWMGPQLLGYLAWLGLLAWFAKGAVGDSKRRYLREIAQTWVLRHRTPARLIEVSEVLAAVERQFEKDHKTLPSAYEREVEMITTRLTARSGPRG